MILSVDNFLDNETFDILNTSMLSKIDSASLNQPAKRPPVTGFDLSKSKRILGYEPRSFDEGIAIIYDQFLKAQTT